MKTQITLSKNFRRIVTLVSLFFALSLVTNTASAQTRSYTLGVLQKTDYIIDEARDIVDYFYYNDGELIARAYHFQDYAYYLFDSRKYSQAVQYSLMSRSYAINALERCDDYWHYYDYHYYGYSSLWGTNASFYAGTTKIQLHFGFTNAAYHNHKRVNLDLYFTSREWGYYRKLPTEIVMVNNYYTYRGGPVIFNDRHRNPQVYVNFSTRINVGRNNFAKSYPSMTKNMSPAPRNIRPSNAPEPTRNTRRETINSNNRQDNNNVRPNDVNNNRPTTTGTSNNRRTDNTGNVPNTNNNNSGTTTGTSNNRRTETTGNVSTGTNNNNSGTSSNVNNNRRTEGSNQSNTSTTRPNTSSSATTTTAPATRRTTETSVPISNRTNKTQDTQAKKETTQINNASSSSNRRTSTTTTEPRQQSQSSSSSSSTSSSTSTDRRR